MKFCWTRSLFLVVSFFCIESLFAHAEKIQENLAGESLIQEEQAKIGRPYNVFFNDNSEFDLANQEATIEESVAGAQAAIDATDEGVEFLQDGFSQEAMVFGWKNLTGRFQVKFKPEMFIARNANLLNNRNTDDFIQFSRSTLDFNFALDYGKDCYGYNVADFFMTMRNKAVWGNPESMVRATVTKIKTLESLDSGHVHFITRQLVWIRELWFNFSVNEALNLPFNSKIFFMLGAFPFELGRGIALGSAYAVNPGVLGFFSDNTIDQYAFGYKLNSEFVPNKLSLDLYGAILQNKGDNFKATGEKIYGQRFRRLLTPARGPGHVDFIIASRLKWFPVKNECALASVEPYLLYNNNPEQSIEFLADAAVRLGTLGLAGEFVYKNFEIGFDGAKNFGEQLVWGWDRNVIEKENEKGLFELVNSQVVSEDPNINPKAPKVVFAPKDPNGKKIQEIIDSSAQDASQNGLLIGTGIDPQTGLPIQLFNSLNRFRNPYRNKLLGWMFVGDFGYWFFDRTLRFAAGGGVASGDEDPNKDIRNPNDSNVDGDFKGFIGLQEIYTGNRIQSVFLLGGAGRIPRPLTTPAQASNVLVTVPTVVSGFTNLVFTGASALWSPKVQSKPFTLRPNILFYWQQHATKKFDITTKMSSTEFARNFLGTEINTFFDMNLLCELKLFVVGSVFIPGPHYTDIKGTPLDKDQEKILDKLDPTGFDKDAVPLLGDDTAYTINIGLEYRF